MSTLLQGVNEVLKKTDVLDSGAELASLTDDARQLFIDTAVQSLNEVLDELYSLARITKPNQLAEATITLVATDQDYALNSNLILLRREFHLIDETNDHVIEILGDDGYRKLVQGDLGQDDTGLPSMAAIRPTDGELWFDRAPTANEAGRVYKYRYDTDLELTLAADTFPFSETVFRAVVPCAAELYKLHRHLEFSQGLFNRNLARAARYLRKIPPRDTYGKGVDGVNITDPMVEL